MCSLRALAAFIIIALVGGPAFAGSPQIVPHARVVPWANYDAAVQARPDQPTIVTNCTEPLTAGNLQYDPQDPMVSRMVVAKNDTPPGGVGRDPKVQRCEWSLSAHKRAYGEDHWQAFSLNIGCFSYTSGQQAWFGQWHASDDAGDINSSHPIWALRLDSMTQLRILISGSTDADSANIVDTTVYTDSAFVCGTPYYYVVKTNASKVGAGTLDVWRAKKGDASFTKIVTRTGLNMGYNDAAGMYWKYGYYGRTNSATAATVTATWGRQWLPTSGSLLFLTTDMQLWDFPN